jgi:hypothetical protein
MKVKQYYFTSCLYPERKIIMVKIIASNRTALSEADSQSILDLFKNFIGSLSDEATLYVTDESCNKQYIIISDWMQSYCIQWIGNDYKFVGQDVVHCEHTTMSNGVKVTKGKEVALHRKHVHELFAYAREISGIRAVLY